MVYFDITDVAWLMFLLKCKLHYVSMNGMETRHWGQGPWNDRHAGWLFGFNGFLKQYFSLTERRRNMDEDIYRNKKAFQK